MSIHYHNAILYWIRATTFVPSHEGYLSSHVKSISFIDKTAMQFAACLVNSSLFYWYWVKTSNCRDLNSADILDFPCDANLPVMDDVANKLMLDFTANSKLKIREQQATGTVSYREYYPSKSKHIIDEIDRVLAQHYGFSDEELDYIINYDIKYRMGLVGGVVEDEEE